MNALLLSASAQPATGNERVANVTVFVSDTFGNPLPGARATLTSVVTRKKFEAMGNQANFNRIPFGSYELELALVGFVTRQERIRVSQFSLAVRIGLMVGTTSSEDQPELSGLITPITKERRDYWVRLVPIYSGDVVENEVEKSGRFELKGMSQGRYVLLVFDKDQLLAARSLTVFQGKQALKIMLDSH